MVSRFSNSDFWFTQIKRKFHVNFEDLPCILTRKIDQQSLELDGIQCLQWIRDMGWTAILNLDEMIFVNYTCLFHANLIANKKDEKLEVFVNGKSHTFSTRILNNILRVLDEGEKLTPTKGSLCIRGYNAKRWVTRLTKGKTSILPSSFMLNNDHRALHYIILEILCPKSGTKNHVSNFEALYKYKLSHRNVIESNYL